MEENREQEFPDMSLADTYIQKGDLNNALLVLEEAKKIYERKYNPEGIKEVYERIEKIIFLRARNRIENLMKTLEATNNPDMKKFIKNINEANELFNQKKYESAAKSYSDALQSGLFLFDQSTSMQLQVYLECLIGFAFEKCEPDLLKAIDFFIRVNSESDFKNKLTYKIYFLWNSVRKNAISGKDDNSAMDYSQNCVQQLEFLMVDTADKECYINKIIWLYAELAELAEQKESFDLAFNCYAEIIKYGNNSYKYGNEDYNNEWDPQCYKYYDNYSAIKRISPWSKIRLMGSNPSVDRDQYLSKEAELYINTNDFMDFYTDSINTVYKIFPEIKDHVSDEWCNFLKQKNQKTKDLIKKIEKLVEEKPEERTVEIFKVRAEYHKKNGEIDLEKEYSEKYCFLSRKLRKNPDKFQQNLIKNNILSAIQHNKEIYEPSISHPHFSIM